MKLMVILNNNFVKEIIYFDDKKNRKVGLIYSEKIVITYNQLHEKLNTLINNE